MKSTPTLSTRRTFLAQLAASATVAGAMPLHGALSKAPLAGLAGSTPANRPVIDCLTPADPAFDVAAARAGGMTAAIVDLTIERTPPGAIEELKRWQSAFARPDPLLACVRTGADLQRAQEQGKFGVILACQSATILGVPSHSYSDTNLQKLREFHELGLRVLQLAHNDRNGVGDSSFEEHDAGLSRLGKAVVATMNELAMIIDLSHCSDNTTQQAIALSTKPCAVTHAGCRALYDTPRNKPDDLIRALTKKGGVFGVYSMSIWLTRNPASSVNDVIDHIDHATKIGGIEHVAYASDGPMLGVPNLEEELTGMQEWAKRNAGLPGAERIPTHARVRELNGADRLMVLADGLRKRGYAADAVDKIIGGNMARLISEVCG
jgi:membrane dipeptidase